MSKIALGPLLNVFLKKAGPEGPGIKKSRFGLKSTQHKLKIKVH